MAFLKKRRVSVWFPLSIGVQRSRNTRSATALTSFCAATARRRWSRTVHEAHPYGLADSRTLFLDRSRTSLSARFSLRCLVREYDPRSWLDLRWRPQTN